MPKAYHVLKSISTNYLQAFSALQVYIAFKQFSRQLLLMPTVNQNKNMDEEISSSMFLLSN